MRVSLTSTGALERRLEVAVPAADVDKVYGDRLKAFGRTARLKGFRPGKAPAKVVEQQFGGQIRQEVVSEVLQNSLNQALAQGGIFPVGNPRIEPLTMAPGQDLAYAAVFEVFPQVTLQGLSSISVERPTADVGAEDVDAMIETLRKQRLNWKTATAPAKEGDRVVLDFDGTLDGVAFEGGKGENVSFILGQGRMLKPFEAGVTGAMAGDTRTFPVEFPSDYQAANLAGKTAEFSVTVKSVEESELPEMDEAFCLAFGITEGGVTQLRAEVEENMRRELADNLRNRVKTQVLDKLWAAHPIDLPAAAVDEQIRVLQIDWLRRIGAKPEDVKQAPPREPFEQAARRRVAVGLLVGEVIRQQGITVDAARFEERLEAAAVGYSDPESAMRQIRDNDQMRQNIEGTILEDQAVEWMLTQMQVVDAPASFKDIMNFGA
jgi:trigger factor